MDGIFIYGAGRVGRALGRAILADGGTNGLALVGAYNRDPARARRTAELLGVRRTLSPAARVVVLAVSDDALADCARSLAPGLVAQHVLLHTSGSVAASVLDVPGMKAHIGSVHPLQALADDDGDPSRLRGCTFAIDGDPDALDAARRIALAAGGRPLEVPAASRALYHTAAVLSANFLTVLIDGSCQLLERAGIPPREGVRMLLPLLRGTLDNLEAYNAGEDALPRALTGPVRRGDAGTVRRNLEALAETGDLDRLYRLLARRALELARRGGLDPERAAEVEDALDSPPRLQADTT